MLTPEQVQEMVPYIKTDDIVVRKYGGQGSGNHKIGSPGDEGEGNSIEGFNVEIFKFRILFG